MWVRLPSLAFMSFFDFFRSTKKIEIRNVPKNSEDISSQFFHAVFSVLCEFFENQYAENPHNFSQDSQTFDTFKAIYEWYISINWNDPVPVTAEYSELINRTKYEIINNPDGTQQIVTQSDATSTRRIDVLRYEHMEREQAFWSDANTKMLWVIKNRSNLLI